MNRLSQMHNAPPTSPIIAALRGRCPQCGEGALFASYLKFADRCRACGATFSAADAGDGPTVFVVLVVGALVVPLLIVLQFGFDLAPRFALTLTMLAAVVLCLALLPPFKAVLFALQWKHKAREVTHDDIR